MSTHTVCSYAIGIFPIPLIIRSACDFYDEPSFLIPDTLLTFCIVLIDNNKLMASYFRILFDYFFCVLPSYHSRSLHCKALYIIWFIIFECFFLLHFIYLHSFVFALQYTCTGQPLGLSSLLPYTDIVFLNVSAALCILA